MAKETKRLGRGLSSLIRTTTEEPSGQAPPNPQPAGGGTAAVSSPPERAPDVAATVSQGVAALPRHFVPDLAASSSEDASTRGQYDHRAGAMPALAPERNSNPSQIVLLTEHVVANRRQPRQRFNTESIAALAGSIARSGLVQPIVVRPLDAIDAPPGERRYEIVAGERRWRASKAAGLTEIPVIVREVDDEQALELALIENIQREDLNAMDRAAAYAAYCREFGLKPEEVAQRLSEDRTTVVNYIRLLDLPAPVKELVSAGELSMGHARALLGVPTDEGRLELARAAVASQLSVRALEDIVRRRKDQADQTESAGETGRARGPSARPKPANVLDLENRLQQVVKTKVRIKEGRRKGHGRVIIDYYSLDDFDRIARLLGLEDE